MRWEVDCLKARIAALERENRRLNEIALCHEQLSAGFQSDGGHTPECRKARSAAKKGGVG